MEHMTEYANLIVEVINVLAPFIAGIYALLRFLDAWKDKDTAKRMDAAKAMSNAKETIVAALPHLVTDAEDLFGPQTNLIKLGYVTKNALDLAHTLLPDEAKGTISPEWIAERVDETLHSVKKIWNIRPDLTQGKELPDAATSSPRTAVPASGSPTGMAMALPQRSVSDGTVYPRVGQDSTGAIGSGKLF